MIYTEDHATTHVVMVRITLLFTPLHCNRLFFTPDNYKTGVNNATHRRVTANNKKITGGKQMNYEKVDNLKQTRDNKTAEYITGADTT